MGSSFRNRYIERLNLLGAILSPVVESALKNVAFDQLVDSFYVVSPNGDYREVSKQRGMDFGSEEKTIVYSGSPLVLAINDGVPTQSTLSAPDLVQILEAMELESGMSILEIGNGVGYLTALLADIVGDHAVSMISAHPRTVRTRELLRGMGLSTKVVDGRDGYFGLRTRAPFDRIAVSVGCFDVSPFWLNQLTDEGFVIVPIDHGDWFPLLRVWKERNNVRARVVGTTGVTIDYITGELGRAEGGLRTKRINPEIEMRKLWGDSSAMSLKDFWFFVSVQNPNTRLITAIENGHIAGRGFGIDDPDLGWGMIISGSGNLLGKSAALNSLDQLYNDWRAARSPRMADYKIEFLAKENSRKSHDDSVAWIRERRHTVQRTQLAN